MRDKTKCVTDENHDEESRGGRGGVRGTARGDGSSWEQVVGGINAGVDKTSDPAVPVTRE